MLRRTLFWAHFGAGVAAGIPILIMCVTGVLLAFERQLLEWADGDLRTVSRPADTQPRALNELLSTVAASAHAAPSSVVLRPAATDSLQFTIGRDRVVYVDPYSGAVLGEGSALARGFFSVVERWHRTLGEPMGARGPLRAVAAAGNLLFFLLALTGCYLWLPKQWSWPRVKAAALLRGDLQGKAYDWNRHNAVGLWCLVPLVLVTLTGVVISYPWANALLFQLSGSPVPARGQQGPPGGREGRGPDHGGSTPIAADLQRAMRAAADSQPGWKTLSARIPGGADTKVMVTVDTGAGGEVEKRCQVLVESSSGEVLKVTRFTDGSPGQRLRALVRFTHTGEEGGFWGQLLAALASAGGAWLVWSGFKLAWRRLFGAKLPQKEPVAAGSASR